MKKQTAFALLLLMSLSLTLPAQVNRCSYVIPRQTDNWLFAQNAGLRFDASGNVSANNPSGNNLPNGSGVSTISDEGGNLLFYTDGQKVYNASNVQINFGPLLLGSPVASSVIVPRPSSPNLYYIFTTGEITNTTTGFNYSMVDMSQGGGVGAVVQHNAMLLAKSSQSVSAVENIDGSGYWVITRGLDVSSFYAYKVTSSGVDINAVESPNMGSVVSSDGTLAEGVGFLKISPDGQRLAYSSFGGKYVELFDFNPETGEVSNPYRVDPPLHVVSPFIGPYSIEFSPDGNKLYVTVISFTNQANNRLYQYDIAAGMRETLLNVSPMAQNPAGLQLARDGKIYVSRVGSTQIGVIGSPNRAEESCNYVEDWIDVPGATGALKRNGFPLFVQSFFDNPHFDYDTKCDGDVTEFWLHNPTFSDATTTWDFGDTLSPNPTASGLRPTHQFSGPGVYNVTVTEMWNGQPFTTTLPVIINALPPKAFASRGDSLYLFPGSRIPLDGGEGMFAYLWQDGSTGRYFDVNTDGLVVVEYEDMNCCRDSDSLKIISLAISLPNAFSPNGDNLNDYFKPLGPSDGIEDFTLTIHDRWGMKVWETTNFSDKWDGTYGGQKLPNGVYAWYLTFNVIGNVSDIGKAKYKGSVAIVR